MIRDFEGIKPEIHESVYVSESAEIIGKVSIGENSSVWYTSVIRGDDEYIKIGKNTNIQDGTVIHGELKTEIGDNVTIGHRAIIHGAKVGNNSLIGMGAILLDGAEIGEFSIVGAGALVTSGKKFPDGMLIIGSPAKAVRELTDEEKKGLLRSADMYVETAEKHKNI